MDETIQNVVPDVSKIKTFYINLKKDAEKNKTFEKNDFINYKRFPALNGKKNKDNDFFIKKISLLTQSKIHFNSRNNHEEINSFGAIGCSLSHYYIWKSFLDEKLDDEYLKLFNEDEDNDKSDLEAISFSKSGNAVEDEYLLIFEDDINFIDVSKLKKQIEDDVRKLTKYKINWDVFLIKHISSRDSCNLIKKEDFSSSINKTNFFSISLNKCNDSYCKINAFFGMQCYIIKKSAIKKIIESNYFFPIECHIDAFLGLLSQKDIINIVSSHNENIKLSDGNLSNIHHSIPIIEYNLIYLSTILMLLCIIIYFVLYFLLKYLRQKAIPD